MKICFNGLGPNHNFIIDGKIYINGSVVELSESAAKHLIKNNIAFEVKDKIDEDEVTVLQNLEIKNKKKREEIIKKAKKVEEAE